MFAFAYGAAFGAIVSSLVDDVFMPIIGLILSGIDFSNLFIVLNNPTGAALDRDELEGLVASQLVVAGDRWVRWATAAQLVQAPRFALLFGVSDQRLHYIMVGAFATVLALQIFVILVLSHPFSGDLAVSPHPILHVVEDFGG